MRIGIYGGTFDPPHHGHLITASDAFEALRLDRLVWIPAAVPPHKQSLVKTLPEVRLAMVRAAVQFDRRFDVLDLELRRIGPSYTVDTLRELHALYGPSAEFFLLFGSDWIPGFRSWRESEEILRLCSIAILRRGEDEIGDVPFPAIALSTRRVDISSTEIRSRVQQGLPVEHLICDRVARMIDIHQLYREA